MKITEYSKPAQKKLPMFAYRKTILFFNVIFMRNIYLLTGVIALILLSGCNNDEYEGRDITGTRLMVYGTVENTQTRVSDDRWETTDVIGITLDGDNNDGYNTNIKYILADEDAAASGIFTVADAAHALYVKSNNEQTFRAYCPYMGEDQVAPEEIPFTIADEDGGYTKHDFLYATASATLENPEVTFGFNHMMSKVTLTFNNTTTKATGTEIEFTLNNIIVNGTFSPQDGTVTSGSVTGSVTIKSAMGETSSVILPPQTTAGVELFIKVNDKYYVTSFDLQTVSQTEYKYDVNIDETEEAPTLTITGTSINPWTSAGEAESLNPTEDPAETLPGITGGQWSSSGNEITDIPESN